MARLLIRTVAAELLRMVAISTDQAREVAAAVVAEVSADDADLIASRLELIAAEMRARMGW